MIILDASNILIGRAHTVIKLLDKFDENAYRQSVMYKIGNLKRKFSKQYGELVIAVDTKDVPYWRVDTFPYYKCRRKIQSAKLRAASDIDWDSIFNISIPKILKEIDTYMPWKLIKVDGCEADDIIGTLTLNTSEPVMILSEDYDFKQLQTRDNVKQYSPKTGNYIIEKHPTKYLEEHIIRGDSGDDIPNIVSQSDSFAIGKRQKSVKATDIVKWLGKDIIDFAEVPSMIERHRLNTKLIDLRCVPKQYQDKILTEYRKTHTGGNALIFDYFVENNLVDLIDSIQTYKERR